MGQYHKPVSIEAEEGINPHDLGCGLKTGEQIFTSPGTAQIMAALVTLRSGNGPADCANSPVVGRWAGTRVLVQGDYAEDGDIPNWSGPPLSELYGAVGFTNDAPTLAATRESYANTRMNGERPGSRGHARLVRATFERDLTSWQEFNQKHPSHAVFADISRLCGGFVEGACSVRFFGTGWRTQIPVKAKAVKIAVGDFAPALGAYMPAPDISKETWDYYNRCGITEADWSRAPASGDWHGLLDSEVDQGQERVLVNLDTMEYLDPASFGEVPTLAGMVRGEYGGVASALFAALVHPERRGGGDIPGTLAELREMIRTGSGGPAAKLDKAAMARAGAFCGRWRGGHILGTSAYTVEERPTTAEVRATGINISDQGMAYLKSIKDW